MSRLLKSALATVLALINMHAVAQPPSNERFNVLLVVSGDEDLQGRLNRCVRAKLRALGDIDLIESRTDASYDDVRLLAMRLSDGTIVCSLASVSVPENKAIKVYNIDPNRRLTSLLVDHKLFSAQKIDKICDDAVSSINAKVFEPMRQFHRELTAWKKKYTPLPKRLPTSPK